MQGQGNGAPYKEWQESDNAQGLGKGLEIAPRTGRVIKTPELWNMFGPPKCEGNGWHTVIKRMEIIELESLGIKNDGVIVVSICACQLPQVGIIGDFIDIEFHNGRMHISK